MPLDQVDTATSVSLANYIKPARRILARQERREEREEKGRKSRKGREKCGGEH
jgi:hypothetical protein